MGYQSALLPLTALRGYVASRLTFSLISVVKWGPWTECMMFAAYRHLTSGQTQAIVQNQCCADKIPVIGLKSSHTLRTKCTRTMKNTVILCLNVIARYFICILGKIALPQVATFPLEILMAVKWVVTKEKLYWGLGVFNPAIWGSSRFTTHTDYLGQKFHF